MDTVRINDTRLATGKLVNAIPGIARWAVEPLKEDVRENGPVNVNGVSLALEGGVWVVSDWSQDVDDARKALAARKAAEQEEAERPHKEASAAINSVSDTSGAPIKVGALVRHVRLDRKGHVVRFDTRGQFPAAIDITRVQVWVRDDAGREYAFNGSDLIVTPADDDTADSDNATEDRLILDNEADEDAYLSWTKLDDPSRKITAEPAEGITWETTGNGSDVALWLGNATDHDRDVVKLLARKLAKSGYAVKVSFPSVMTFLLTYAGANRYQISVPGGDEALREQGFIS